MQLGRAAGRIATEKYCKSNQMCSWGKQLLAVRWKTLVNPIKHAVGESSWPRAVGESSWPPRDGKKWKSNPACSWGEQLLAVRWKTVVNLIKHAVGRRSWPPYNETQL